MERELLAKIEWDADNDLYLVKIASTDGTNVQFVAGTQLLADLESEVKRVHAEMSA